MSDYISRADAIEAVCKAVCEDDASIFPECDQIKYCYEIQALLALPSADAVSRKAKCCPIAETCMSIDCPVSSEYIGRQSADAVPKWTCTANFVAEQLDRLREMTDEEKWEFFKKFFEIKGGDDE